MNSKYILYLLMVLLVFSISNIFFLDMVITENADSGLIINDIGRLRGGTQRVVKLEMMGVHDETLISKIDGIYDTLLSLTNKHSYDEIGYDLIDAREEWQLLMDDLNLYRMEQAPAVKEQILHSSENMWQTLDATVTLSQVESETGLKKIKYLVLFSLTNILVILFVFKIVRSYVKEELELSVNKDYLTKLYNRKFMMSFLEVSSKKIIQSNRRLGILMLDIDNFKHVNDTYGHNFGDEVLVKTARAIESAVHHSDVVCRFGGEEFSVIITEANEKIMMDVSERIRLAVENNPIDHVDHITISVGAYISDAKDPIIKMIEKADLALYKAKASGKNCVVHYQEPMGNL